MIGWSFAYINLLVSRLRCGSRPGPASAQGRAPDDLAEVQSAAATAQELQSEIATLDRLGLTLAGHLDLGRLVKAVTDAVGEAYSMLSVAETALQGGGAPPPSQVPGKLKAEAATLPEPAKSLVQNLASASGSVAAIQLREILSREVRAQVGEFCQQAAAGRYPLDRNATREVTPADFAQLFGPSGKVETLVQQTLKPYVDTTTRPWRFRPLEGIPLGKDAGSLPQFQRAAAIRETFFPPGAAGLALRLEFKPVEMDASIRHFILDVDGQLGALRPWAGDSHRRAVARSARQFTGARIGRSTERQRRRVGDDHRRAVGTVPHVRARPDRSRQLAGKVPRDLHDRWAQGGLRRQHEQRAQPVPTRRTGRIPMPAGTLKRP